ncbi:hypothetical protein BDZ45DRAFT_457063 [Acephala macrosclerotiorum]|nr:hypothetical protein BDZ45DRAFT_457063 [Acephala macrosclerotiorum]
MATSINVHGLRCPSLLSLNSFQGMRMFGRSRRYPGEHMILKTALICSYFLKHSDSLFIFLWSSTNTDNRQYSKIKAAIPTAIGVAYEVPLNSSTVSTLTPVSSCRTGPGPGRSSPMIQKLSLPSKTGGLKVDHSRPVAEG